MSVRSGQSVSKVVWKLVSGAVLGAAVAASLSTVGRAQTARTVQDGVYTDAQAARGHTVYRQQCASCHGNALEGAQAPPLVGDSLVGRWQSQPLSDFVNKIRNTMPADKPGTLTLQQSADVVAHMLKTGGFKASTTELAGDEAALARIGWPKSAVEQVSSSQVRVYPPLGNMAQLMRGIFFPNSNLIFTVQTRDPGAKVEPAQPGNQTGGFSFVDWGAGIYGGWELVDNAAIALADAAPLMLAPGIRCENGRPAPINDPDWIKFTEQMIAVARKTYQASQSRKQDAVAEATGDLSDACAACHQAYRDIRTRERAPDPTDPSNKAARCMPR
jgi:mono/diheme cytochrome c family protein